MHKIPDILQWFGINASEIRIESIPTGHVNETFKIYADTEQFILQKINTDIFSTPEKVMHNIKIAQEHIRNGLKGDGIAVQGRFPEYLNYGDKNYLSKDGFWRIYRYIESINLPPDYNSVRVFGELLGEFHRYTKSADVSKLYITIDNFHNIEKNISAAVKCDGICNETSDYFSKISKFFNENKNCLSEKRLVHNDVKWANVLICPQTGLPTALIDYDTVMEGYAAFDFGDAVRSACVTNDFRIDKSMLRNFSDGYSSQYPSLCAKEKALGILAISTELSARYLHSCLGKKNSFPAMSLSERLERHEKMLTLSKNIFENYSEIINNVG